MSRKFIAGVVAAAIAITAFGNKPAEASDDLAAALAATVGAAVVGKIIYDHLNDDRAERATRDIYDRTYFPSSRPVPPRFDNRIRVQPRFDNRIRVQPRFDNRVRAQPRFNNGVVVPPRPLPLRANRAVLPGECLRRSSNRQVFAKRCLKKNYGFTRSLPQDCEVKFRANGKKQKGYRAACLGRAGYRASRY